MANTTSSFHLYPTAEAAWNAMYADCEAATQSILFEQYIIKNDPAGARFLRLFARKAAAGVHIRLILDSIGSYELEGSNLIQDLMDKGGEVRFYRKLRWWHLFFPDSWYPRNHAKTMLIDDQIAYVGSVCLAEYMRSWHEMHARITGDVITTIKAEFAYHWARIHKRKTVKKPLPAFFDGISYIANLPAHGPNPVYRTLLKRIKHAKHSVYLVSPYFFCTHKLQARLKRAAKRGLEVKVMISQDTDVPFADLVSHSYIPHMLRDGITLLAYHETVLHAKYAIVDNDWATIGSMNFDWLSFFRNRETNIIIEDPSHVTELKRYFQQDASTSIVATEAMWKDKPLLHKLIGYAGRLVKGIL